MPKYHVKLRTGTMDEIEADNVAQHVQTGDYLFTVGAAKHVVAAVPRENVYYIEEQKK